jgi:two-component system chemotaxis response regulator CheB
MTIRVGIIDDSLMVRSALEKMIDSESAFTVAGTAEDVYEGRSMLLEEDPDVLTLDVEMPRMDGLTFLEKLMQHQPMPVVMVSSLTSKTSRKGMEALETGAVELVAKPDGDKTNSIQSLRDDLIPKLEAAYRARDQIATNGDVSRHNQTSGNQPDLPEKNYDVILIGSSTGGVKALRTIFENIQGDLPPILIVQHMPPVFTKNFAERLNSLSEPQVSEATDGQTLRSGEACLAPGDKHMAVRRLKGSGNATVTLNEDDKVHSQRPSVDILFESASREMKNQNVLSITLTGMGKDGRDGATALENQGATIVVQDRTSSTIYGMPKQVKENVQSAIECPLEGIASLMNSTKLTKKPS